MHSRLVCCLLLAALFPSSQSLLAAPKSKNKSKKSVKVDPKRIAEGKKYYEAPGSCVACHMPDGKGQYGSIPPLAKSPWVTDNPDRLISITLAGLQGPIKVNNMKYHAMMPPQLIFNDAQTADILTYVRNAWGNKASAITEKQVAAIRKTAPKVMYEVNAILKKYPFKDKKIAKANGTFNIKNELLIGADIEKPFVMRTFMPGASPAAIAVALPGGQNYCFDAGESRLRYAWLQGGYIKFMKSHWSTNGKPVPLYGGQAYYTAHSSKLGGDESPQVLNDVKRQAPIYDTSEVNDFPIAISGISEGTRPKFRGYRLVNHHPEYMYTLGEVMISELIKATKDNTGIERHFKIDTDRAVTLSLTPDQKSTLSSSVGTIAKDGKLKLSAGQAKSFVITIKEKPAS